jgi:circadian clock protein KaiC
MEDMQMTQRKKKQSKTTMAIPKLETGIKGLDFLSYGGFPKGRTTLCVGSSGAGKTILGVEYLWKGMEEFNEPAVFVTFEENAEAVTKTFESFGWDLRKKIQEGKCAIVDLSFNVPKQPIREGEIEFDVLLARIKSAVEKTGAKRVVIDSINALFGKWGNREGLRRVIFDFIEHLNQLGATTLMTAERVDEYGPISRYGVEEFVSDNVVILRLVLEHERIRRTMQILKFRRSTHKTGEFPFTITSEGMIILPLAGMRLDQPSSTVRIACGKELDKMCGGGFFKDSVILVSGPTGTGKTLLSCQFMDSCCKSGDKGILFAYEESKAQLLRNAESWGMNLAKWEKKGLLRIVCDYPEVMGPEDHLVIIKKELAAFQPKRIVVDSLSAMERVLTLKSFREFVLNLTSYLKQNEIAAMFTSTTKSLLGGESITEAHISTLTDAIIILRYVEMHGEMRRGLTVIKMRGSWHEKEIREYNIDDRGMHIREPFRGVESIMTGAARTVTMYEEQELAKISKVGRD